MAISISPLTISAGTSLSPALQVPANLRVVRLGTPADWGAASLTFQTSLDDVNYLDLYRIAQTPAGPWTNFEVSLLQIIPGSVLLLPNDAGFNIGWLKLRSGTRAQPVVQQADRTFEIVFG